MGRVLPTRGRTHLGTPGARGALGALGLLLALPLAAGCSGSSTNASTAGQSKPGIEGGLETVASTAGCAKPQLQDTKGSGFRHGVCRVGSDRFTVMSFTDQEQEKTWLHEAKQWGGTYLVGPKWVVVATMPTLQSLQEKLGGDISQGSSHDSPNGDSVGTG